jgi:transposase
MINVNELVTLRVCIYKVTLLLVCEFITFDTTNKEVFILIYIGIDIAKDHHDIVIIDDYGEIIKEHFQINNDKEGFKKLHTEIKSCMKSLNDIHIGMEETGIYHENLRDFLISKGFTVYTINPLLTSYSRKASSPRLTKTDKIDATAICRYIMNNIRFLHSYTPSLYYIDELKQLSRTYHHKKQLLSKTKMELKRLLQIGFPEFTKHFDPYAKWSLDILGEYPLPTFFKGLHTEALAARIKTKSDRLANAILLKQLATDSIGKCDDLRAFLVRSIISDFKHYESQTKELKKIITAKMVIFPKIMSVPGIGPINGATILGETGDIHRFNNKHEYYAFYGCDPIIHESGNYKLKNSRLSKRGDKYLRTAIYSASRVACVGKFTRDNKFQRKYLCMKAKDNKHHNTIIFAVAKNMVHSIFNILRMNESYDDFK